jgi:hypothetical protein
MTPSDDSTNALRAVMAPGERLQWSGRPGPAALPGWQLDAKPLVVGLPSLATALFLLWSILSSPFTGIFDLICLAAGLFFLCTALWQLSASLRAALAVRRTLYAVTDRRLLILTSFPRRRLRAFTPDMLDEPQLRDRGDGFGDVVFAAIPVTEWTREGRRLKLAEAAFIDIPDPERVRREIARLKARATAGRAVAQGTA